MNIKYGGDFMYTSFPNVEIEFISGEQHKHTMNKEELQDFVQWLRDTKNEELFEYQAENYLFFFNKKAIANVTIG